MVKRSAITFKARRTIAAQKVPFEKAKPLVKETLEAMIIKGQPAGSKEEYFVAQGLNKLGLKYSYQVPVMGGRNVRGGQVLDFLVYTPGKYTIVDVRGTYWHTGAREDSLDILRVTRNYGWELLVAWDTDVPDEATALSFLRIHLGGT